MYVCMYTCMDHQSSIEKETYEDDKMDYKKGLNHTSCTIIIIVLGIQR